MIHRCFAQVDLPCHGHPPRPQAEQRQQHLQRDLVCMSFTSTFIIIKITKQIVNTWDQILAHSGIRWFWIFWYFERNVPLQLPRHYSLPLPRFDILTFLFRPTKFILFIFTLPSQTVLKAGMEGDGYGVKLEGAGNPQEAVKHPPICTILT